MSGNDPNAEDITRVTIPVGGASGQSGLGSAGQVLTKTGAGSTDFEWRNPTGSSFPQYNPDAGDTPATSALRSFSPANVKAIADESASTAVENSGITIQVSALEQRVTEEEAATATLSSAVSTLASNDSTLDTRVTALESAPQASPFNFVYAGRLHRSPDRLSVLCNTNAGAGIFGISTALRQYATAIPNLTSQYPLHGQHSTFSHATRVAACADGNHYVLFYNNGAGGRITKRVLSGTSFIDVMDIASPIHRPAGAEYNDGCVDQQGNIYFTTGNDASGTSVNRIGKIWAVKPIGWTDSQHQVVIATRASWPYSANATGLCVDHRGDLYFAPNRLLRIRGTQPNEAIAPVEDLFPSVVTGVANRIVATLDDHVILRTAHSAANLNFTLRKVSTQTGAIAWTQLITSANTNYPGICLDKNGDVYINVFRTESSVVRSFLQKRSGLTGELIQEFNAQSYWYDTPNYDYVIAGNPAVDYDGNIYLGISRFTGGGFNNRARLLILRPDMTIYGVCPSPDANADVMVGGVDLFPGKVGLGSWGL
jgi:hypothetical protein